MLNQMQQKAIKLLVIHKTARLSFLGKYYTAAK